MALYSLGIAAKSDKRLMSPLTDRSARSPSKNLDLADRLVGLGLGVVGAIVSILSNESGSTLLLLSLSSLRVKAFLQLRSPHPSHL